MAGQEGFEGSWQDNEGNALVLSGETVTGPAGMKLDIAFTSNDMCSIQMGDDIFEGKLSPGRSRITWSDGEAWVRTQSALAAAVPAAAEGTGKGRGTFQPQARGQVATPPRLSLEDALQMQEELHEAFSAPAFQMKLSELHRNYPQGKGAKFLASRNNLFLEVQSKILPKYNFEGSQKGVVQMLQAAAQHNHDKEFCRKRTSLNQLLGLEAETDEEEPEKKPSSKDGAHMGLRNIIFRNQNIASAHQHLLGPSSLQMNLTKPQKVAQKEAANYLAELSNHRKLEDMLERTAQETGPLEDVEILAREALGDLEVKVTVPATATFNDVKEAVSMHVGRPDCVKRGHLVRHADGNYTPFKGTSTIGDVREVLVLRASLEVHDDDEAQAWRTELEAEVQQRKAKHKTVVAAAKKRQQALAEKELEIASRTVQGGAPAQKEQSGGGAPYGDCFIIGTWDDFTAKHEMAWDGTAYRIGMNLQGMEQVSFQVQVQDDRRIFPDTANAGPGVPHNVMGPDSVKNELYWTLQVEAADGQEDQCTYEIALHCPSGSPMALQWEKISLDSIQWYPTEEQE